MTPIQLVRSIPTPKGYPAVWRAGYKEGDLTGSVYEGDPNDKPAIAGIFFRDGKPIPAVRLADRGTWDAGLLYALSEYAINVARALREHGHR